MGMYSFTNHCGGRMLLIFRDEPLKTHLTPESPGTYQHADLVYPPAFERHTITMIGRTTIGKNTAYRSLEVFFGHPPAWDIFRWR